MATLAYMDADGIERSLTVGHEPVLIGRAPECAIRSNDPLVSRNHARLFLDQGGTLCIEDLGSSNGVYVGPHKVMSSIIPIGELVVVGSLKFWQVPPNVAVQQVAMPPQQIMMHPSPHQAPVAMDQPPAMPPPQAAMQQQPPPSAMQQQPADAHGALAHLIEVERQARIAAEQERDAYGARMAELHQELRKAKDAYGLLEQQEHTVRGEIEQLRRKPVVNLPLPPDASPEERVAAMADEVESHRQKLSDEEDKAKSAEARLQSTEEELAVARADLLASEERLMSELASAEERAGAELAARVDELGVARTDLAAAEDRIMDLSRRVAELEQRLAYLGEERG